MTARDTPQPRGGLVATPLLVRLVFGVTTDPFIVFTSNAMAILSLVI